MSELEQKEIDLNVLKAKVDGVLKNNHPASDKIQVSVCVSDGVCRVLTRPAVFLAQSHVFLTGLHGDAADAVELAAADHQVHQRPPEGERTIQPGELFPGICTGVLSYTKSKTTQTKNIKKKLKHFCYLK